MKVKLAVIVVLCVVAYKLLFEKESEWPIKNFKANPQNIVAFGDSLTSGVGANPGKNYVEQLSEKISTQIVNKGVSGSTTQAWLQILPEIIDLEPEMVLITLTGNDIMQQIPRESAVANMRTIYKELTDAGIMVVYLSIAPPFVNKKWEQSLKELAKEQGVIWVDRVMKSLWTDRSMMSDTIHPNSSGYAVMADRVYQRLQELKIF